MVFFVNARQSAGFEEIEVIPPKITESLLKKVLKHQYHTFEEEWTKDMTFSEGVLAIKGSPKYKKLPSEQQKAITLLEDLLLEKSAKTDLSNRTYSLPTPSQDHSNKEHMTPKKHNPILVNTLTKKFKALRKKHDQKNHWKKDSFNEEYENQVAALEAVVGTYKDLEVLRTGKKEVTQNPIRGAVHGSMAGIVTSSTTAYLAAPNSTLALYIMGIGTAIATGIGTIAGISKLIEKKERPNDYFLQKVQEVTQDIVENRNVVIYRPQGQIKQMKQPVKVTYYSKKA